MGKSRSRIKAIEHLNGVLRNPLNQVRLSLASWILGPEMWEDLRDILLPDQRRSLTVRPRRETPVGGQDCTHPFWWAPTPNGPRCVSCAADISVLYLSGDANG